MTIHEPPTRTAVTPAGALRASDAERERTAARLRDAAAQGRLTLAEADERQALAYAARTLDDLIPLTTDLPEPEPDRVARRLLTPRARLRLAVHGVVVAVLAVLMVTAWALSPAPWFWPAWPLFWLAVSLVVHHRLADRPDPSP